jgi:hypothetical protein
MELYTDVGINMIVDLWECSKEVVSIVAFMVKSHTGEKFTSLGGSFTCTAPLGFDILALLISQSTL